LICSSSIGNMIAEALGYDTRCRGITQFYLLPTRLSTNVFPAEAGLYSPTSEGWKAELAHAPLRFGPCLPFACNDDSRDWWTIVTTPLIVVVGQHRYTGRWRRQRLSRLNDYVTCQCHSHASDILTLGKPNEKYTWQKSPTTNKNVKLVIGVRLPHCRRHLPVYLLSHSNYQRPCTYRRTTTAGDQATRQQPN